METSTRLVSKETATVWILLEENILSLIKVLEIVRKINACTSMISKAIHRTTSGLSMGMMTIGGPGVTTTPH